MIKIYQSGILPLGQFDIRDSDLSNIRGGEVLVFDFAPDVAGEKRVSDIYPGEFRTNLRLADGYDKGPFFFADGDKNSGQYSSPGFEVSSAFSRNAPFAQQYDSSSKVSIFADEGFYSISSDMFQDGYLNEATPPNTELYVNSEGRLTTEVSPSKVVVAYVIQVRENEILTNNLNRPFYTAGSFEEEDSIIVFKTNSDGYSLVSRINELSDDLGEQISDLISGDTSVGIGTPDDGYYTDGFFPFISSTTTANAIDDINELLAAIAPEKPGDLTGQSLSFSGATAYSARLPDGLSAIWYSGGDSPGDIISSYIVDNAYTLTSPDQSNRFNGGPTSNPTQLGTLTHVINGSDVDSRDIAANGTGITGTINVTDISVYNTIWNKINAEISVTQTSEGRETHAMKHSFAGTTNSSEFFYDPDNTAPSFEVGASITENTAVDGYLSGVLHYAIGSSFDVSYTAAMGIFNRAYHPTEVSRIEIPGLVNTAVNPATVPIFTSNFPVLNETVSLNDPDVSVESPNLIVRLFKPNGDTASSTASIGRPINTFGTESTATEEFFVDEARRLNSFASTSPDFTSSNLLSDGQAQVYISGSGGQVSFPRGSDYPSFVATEQIYQRHFTKATASSGTIVFGGLSVSDIDPYGTGDTNVLLQLDDDNLFFDCGLPFGSDNGDASGDSLVNSIGCQLGSSSGSTLNFSFGINSTANNGNRYRLIVIFRNSNDSITSIITS